MFSILDPEKWSERIIFDGTWFYWHENHFFFGLPQLISSTANQLLNRILFTESEPVMRDGCSTTLTIISRFLLRHWVLLVKNMRRRRWVIPVKFLGVSLNMWECDCQWGKWKWNWWPEAGSADRWTFRTGIWLNKGRIQSSDTVTRLAEAQRGRREKGDAAEENKAALTLF